MFVVLLLLLPSALMANSVDFGTQCIETCMAEMQKVMEETELTMGYNLPVIDMESMKNLTKGEKLTKTTMAFDTICKAYSEVDDCLSKCPKNNFRSNHSRNVFGALKLICVDYRRDFFTHLRCFVEYEDVVLSECREKQNRVMVASKAFADAITNKQPYELKDRLAELCRFVVVGFTSLSQLYAQLDMSRRLPLTCVDLLRYCNETVSNGGAGAGRHVYDLSSGLPVHHHTGKGVSDPLDRSNKLPYRGSAAGLHHDPKTNFMATLCCALAIFLFNSYPTGIRKCQKS